MNTPIPTFPRDPTGHPTIYVSTDRTAQEAGCSWGLLVAHLSGNFWVLTNIGVRYYGIESEHAFVHYGDPRWAGIHATWRTGLAAMADEQRASMCE